MKKTQPDGNKTIYVGGIYEVDKTPGGSVKRTVTYYPVAGAMRIVDSTGNTLYYTLKDHLGSASVVTDSTGVIVGEQRYYPYGETHFTSGTIYTDKLYTGQREMAGLGIYHYNARFYSPYLNQFTQPDSIVPNLYNPQSLNRYSYTLNNPIRYTDPTGHMVADDDGGGLTIAGYIYVIEQRFDWQLEDEFSLEEVKTIYQTGHDIETYLDGLTDGNGLAWMVNRFGNTTIDHVNFADGHSDTWPTLSGSQIRLNDNWLNDAWGAEVVFAHELGHVWDINSSFAASYLMNLDLGGSGVCLFCASGNGVPKWGLGYHPHNGDAYGNSGRNEYFAEAFAAAIYERGSTDVVSSAIAWIDSNITVPLYFNPWTGQR